MFPVDTRAAEGAEGELLVTDAAGRYFAARAQPWEVTYLHQAAYYLWRPQAGTPRSNIHREPVPSFCG